MNSTSNLSEGIFDGNINGYGYFIGISLGIILLIVTFAVASYMCHNSRHSNPPSQLPPPRHRGPPDLEVGLDEKTLESYPKLVYSEAKLRNKHASSSCCSICLGDYISTDTVRLLPDCGHIFHLKCVDSWLRLHPTCPVCRRSSPIPTPESTPLAEMALATRITFS